MRKLTASLALLLAGLLPQPVQAHAGESHDSLAWSLEPWVVAGLVLCAAVYAAGLWRSTRRAGWGRVFGATEAGCFAVALAVLVVALVSPVDIVATALFSVHMVQHLLLMLVAAPFLVWSALPLAALWALPPPARRALGRWQRGSVAGRALALLGHPLSVWVLYAAVFLFWHIPGPYRWAVQSELVHSLEHVSILLAGVLFWTVVIGPAGARSLDHGARLLFVATAAVLGGLPGALMILSPRPFYAVHEQASAAWGLTPLEDQQLAGLIMWIPGGLIYLGAASALFLLWLRSAERRAQAAQDHLVETFGRGGITTLALLLMLAGYS